MTPEPTSTPVTIIGGYLGAGKTTFLNHLLSQSQNQRWAVLINDFGALNIDADLIASHDGTTYTLTNGCVCCSIASTLAETLAQLADAQASDASYFDGVLIEASGVAQPSNIAAAVELWPSLSLVGNVIFQDGAQIIQQWQDKYIGPLIQSQCTQADVLVLNKMDLLEADEQLTLRSWQQKALRSIPTLLATHAGVTWSALFDEIDSNNRLPAQRQAPVHSAQFRSLTLEQPVSLDLEAVQDVLDRHTHVILRAKGNIELADGQCAHLQQVGRHIALNPLPLDAGVANIGCVFITLVQHATELQALLADITD